MPGESVIECVECGWGLRAAARFCDNCGAPLAPQHGADERKNVTVLFTDVVGSLSMAGALDPERLREIMRELFNGSAAIIQRYRGTVDKFTGDGLMAIFGAPTAIEDHALRACIAALEIQSLARGLAVDVRQRDGLDLQLRVGLNSGDVVVGEIGSGPGRYTAVGLTVGLAQRMEAAAAAGTILCAASTTALVERTARLGPVEVVSVKGADGPVEARRLEAVLASHLVMARDGCQLVGREDELARLTGTLKLGPMSVTGIVGEPGVGKSRLIREFAANVSNAGATLLVTRCESHTAHVPLQALSRMLRALLGVGGLDAASARGHIATQLAGLHSEDGDADILYGMLSLGESASTPTLLTASTHRRRLINLMSRVVRSRDNPTVFVVDDAHWVDTASDDALAEFFGELAGTRSTAVVSFRPEYRGRLRDIATSTIVLNPLAAEETNVLAARLLGRHGVEQGLAARIATSAAGNPFFVEEIIRELAGRAILQGDIGNYRVCADPDTIAVPATVQTVLASRIDRLPLQEKEILNAAAVIGMRFGLADMQILQPVTGLDLDNLAGADLINRIQLVPEPRYEFRHPLVRAVCYESQLTRSRARSHALLAAAIERRNPDAVQKNSALIAHHLEAAGDLSGAYSWYMRSGDWLKYRDIMAARDSWERACAIADRMPSGPGRTIASRIDPRAQLVATAWLVGNDSAQTFAELRSLTADSGDRWPLALGMSGRVTSLVSTDGQPREAALMAGELEGLIGEIDGYEAEKAEILMSIAYARYVSGELDDALRTTDRLRQIPDADPSEVTPATALAGAIKVMLGQREPGERDVRLGVDGARAAGPLTFVIAVGYWADLVLLGFDRADQAFLSVTAEALRTAEAFGDAYGLALARFARGLALVRQDAADVDAGIDLLGRSRSEGLDVMGSSGDAEIVNAAAVRGRRVDLAALRTEAEWELANGEVVFIGHSIAVLVEFLCAGGVSADLSEARDLTRRLERLISVYSLPVLSLWPLLCRARIAGAATDPASFTSAVTEYRALAGRLDARCHLDLADRLTAEAPQ